MLNANLQKKEQQSQRSNSMNNPLCLKQVINEQAVPANLKPRYFGKLNQNIVIVDESMITTESIKVMLLDLGYKGEISQFFSCERAQNFIINYTKQHLGIKTVDAVFIEHDMKARSGAELTNYIMTNLQKSGDMHQDPKEKDQESTA